MKKRSFNLPVTYMSRIDGVVDWYAGMYFSEDMLDLYDVEQKIKSGKDFSGNKIYLIHHPDGAVYVPFETRANVYYGEPVWDKDQFGILAVDFSAGEIIVYTYIPGSDPMVLVTIPLSSVKDCYNLNLEISPWTLGRWSGDKYEMIWPIRKAFHLKEKESVLYRNGNVLYLSRWMENPHYHEYVVTVDINTGEEINVERGSLYLMPDGTFWNV